MNSVIGLIALGWSMGVASILIKHLIDKFYKRSRYGRN